MDEWITWSETSSRPGHRNTSMIADDYHTLDQDNCSIALTLEIRRNRKRRLWRPSAKQKLQGVKKKLWELKPTMSNSCGIVVPILAVSTAFNFHLNTNRTISIVMKINGALISMDWMHVAADPAHWKQMEFWKFPGIWHFWGIFRDLLKKNLLEILHVILLFVTFKSLTTQR